MAALCGLAGSCVCRNSRIFRHLQKGCVRSNVRCRAVSGQQEASSKSEPAQEVVIPRKKTWNELAVLQALASTVNRDPTASHYMFQDDPFLAPRTASESKLYTLSLEAGRNAAKYVFTTYPKYFMKDYAEPHIPCLMPESVQADVTEVCEAALVELIRLRRVHQAVDMFDKLLQAGTAVPLDISNDLLDLICFYGDQNPQQEQTPDQVKTEDGEEVQDQAPKRRDARSRKVLVWRKNNNAERIFDLLPQRNERSYSALIRGMVKCGAYTKAFDVYTDMLNNKMYADVHTFNALIAAAPEVREKYSDKWELIIELLKQMRDQDVRPGLLTFNAVLKSALRCGAMSRQHTLHTLSEMKALGIEPSLASYYYILLAFYRSAFGPSASLTNVTSDILHKIVDEISGKAFAACDPDDVNFFNYAMKVCWVLKDLGLAYRVHKLLTVGDNWKLHGSSSQEAYYYGRFFSLICMMENVDVVLRWYRDLVPSLFYPNSNAMRDMLQALDTDSRLDLIPDIWKDIEQMGLANKVDLVEEVLSLMARDRHSSEVHESFAQCALAVKRVYGHGEQSQASLEWSTSSLSNVASILLAAGREKQAWEMLPLFKANNRVPTDKLLSEFMMSAKGSRDSQQAVGLVQLSASFSLPGTGSLAERVRQEFELSDEHKKVLEDVEALINSSNEE